MQPKNGLAAGAASLGTLITACGGQPSMVSAVEPLYVDAFSLDPGWVTDQPVNYYWDIAQESFHATTANAQPSQSPTRYAYRPVDYNGESIRLTFDIQLVQLEVEAGVHFGLFDENLMIGALPGSTDVNFLHVHPARRLNGDLIWTLRVIGSNGMQHVEHIGLNSYSEGVWYRCTMTFDAAADLASLQITERDSGALVGTASVSNIGGLPTDLDFLGFARDPAGNCCAPVGAGCTEPAWCAGSGTAIVDNVTLSQLIAEDVPAVSDWGLIVTAVAISAIATAVLRRKQHGSCSPG